MIGKEARMRVAAVSELKARLSEYLNHVKTGEEVVITDRGKPVARLIAAQQARPEREMLSRMARQGLIKIGSGKLPVGFWKMPRPEDPQLEVLKALLEESQRVSGYFPNDLEKRDFALL
jgi:prevent-host-death family protein